MLILCLVAVAAKTKVFAARVTLLFAAFLCLAVLSVNLIMGAGADKAEPVAEEITAAFGTSLDEAERFRSNGKWIYIAFDNAALRCDAVKAAGRDDERVSQCTFSGDLSEYAEGVEDNLVLSDDHATATVTLSDRTLEVREE